MEKSPFQPGSHPSQCVPYSPICNLDTCPCDYCCPLAGSACPWLHHSFVHWAPWIPRNKTRFTTLPRSLAWFLFLFGSFLSVPVKSLSQPFRSISNVSSRKSLLIVPVGGEFNTVGKSHFLHSGEPRFSPLFHTWLVDSPIPWFLHVWGAGIQPTLLPDRSSNRKPIGRSFTGFLEAAPAQCLVIFPSGFPLLCSCLDPSSHVLDFEGQRCVHLSICPTSQALSRLLRKRYGSSFFFLWAIYHILCVRFLNRLKVCPGSRANADSFPCSRCAHCKICLVSVFLCERIDSRPSVPPQISAFCGSYSVFLLSLPGTLLSAHYVSWGIPAEVPWRSEF